MNSRNYVVLNFEQHAYIIPSITAGMNVYYSPQLVVTNTYLDCDTVNIIVIRNGRNLSMQELEQYVKLFREGDQQFCIWVEKQDLTEQLQQSMDLLGLRNAESEPGMMFDANKFEKEPFVDEQIRIVRTAEELKHFADVISQNWEPPDQQLVEYYRQVSSSILSEGSPTTLAVYYERNEAVACVEMFHPDSETGGIYSLSTLKRNRGRGIGTALMKFSLSYLHSKGVRRIILQASEDGVNIYRKLGFEVVCTFFEFK